jgi:DNA-binding XRE family transcriptional regulator
MSSKPKINQIEKERLKYFRRIKIQNSIKRLTSKPVENIYLFILCPPFGGSTVLNEFLSSSDNVSVNNPFDTREGQQLPGVRKMMWEHEKRWDPETKYDWQFIKKEWQKYWDRTKVVLLEKSPPNIIRATEIEENFKPSYFISMVRNPYAHTEGLMRRNNVSATEAASFSIKCLKYQKFNIENLSNLLLIKYEDFTDNNEETKNKILNFLPALKDLNSDIDSKAKNFKGEQMKITNLDHEKNCKTNT